MEIPTPVDIALAHGRIAALAPTVSAAAVQEWDLAGRVVLPGLVDAHTHLDKSYFPMPNQSGTLLEAIDLWRAHKGSRTRADIAKTVRQALRTAIANGITAMRSHIDVEANGDLATVETVLAIREEFRDQLDLQLVALGYPGGTREQRQTMRTALDLGLDLVGGAPALTADPHVEIDACFALAEATGKPLDLHIDETEDPQMLSLDYLAAKTKVHGLHGRVTAGHCCSLAFVDNATIGRVLDNVASAQLNLVTLPSCNLVLMGRAIQPVPRGVAPVRAILAHEINICAASDNVHDPFNPFGNYDLLQIANLTAHVAHLTGTAEIQTVLEMVTTKAAQTLNLPNHAITVGSVADLVVLDTTEPLHAVTTVPPRLATVKQGKMLLRTTITQTWA
ncbi:MAG TPA: amidohydrolase family protein [Caldilineaceae bacterium]|nr:amidohydrolase family protein [Caldilineaceae bacterium]